MFSILFSIWIRKTAFKTITGGVISRKWISLASHALVALLLAPEKFWSLEIHRQQQQRILPSQRFQLARDCLVWGIRLVCGSAIVGQVTKTKGFYQLWPGPPCIFLYLWLWVWYASAYLRCRLMKIAKSGHNVMRRFLLLVLDSLASKSHTTEKKKLTKPSLGSNIINSWVM